MGITIKNRVNIQQHIRTMNESIERAMGKAVELGAGAIHSRTQHGQDENDNGFKPYSPSYAAFRAKAGRNTAPVDLTFTGEMLNSIQTKVEGAGDKVTGIIYLTGEQARKARENEEMGRKFFGFGERLAGKLKQLFKQEVKA